MSNPRVAIGILAYARVNDLALTLCSVAALTTPSVTTILLQSGMSDAEFEQVVKSHPWVTAVSNQTNLGAAGGRNRLIDLALGGDYDYLFFLDSDALPAPDALDKLLSIYPTLERPALVGCIVRVLERPQEIHSSGVSFDYFSLRDIHHTDLPAAAAVECQAIITTAVLVACQVLDQLPRLDERIFAYWEDLDWCLRIGAVGWKHYVVRDAIAYHALWRPRFHPAVIYYKTRNHLLVASKLGKPWHYPVVRHLMWETMIHHLHRIRVLTPLGLNCFIAVLIAYWHVIIGRWGIAPAWMRRADEQFLEFRLRHFFLQPHWVAMIKRIVGH